VRVNGAITKRFGSSKSPNLTGLNSVVAVLVIMNSRISFNLDIKDKHYIWQ
jgi:hypothetical protein